MSYTAYKKNEEGKWELFKEFSDHNDALGLYNCMVGQIAMISNMGERLPEDFVLPEEEVVELPPQEN